jgi:hypothetical protein
MPAPTKQKCKLCGKNPLLPIPRPDGTDSSFLACENCDDPKGTLPKLMDPG